MRPSASLLLLPVLLVALGGCLSPRTVLLDARYTLQPEVVVTPVAQGAETLGLRPLQVARPYTQQMAYIDAGHRFGYRSGGEWTEHPGSLVTRVLNDALGASGRFEDVGNAADMTIPSLILTGEIRKFHEDRTASPPTAVVELRLELRAARAPGLIWAETLQAAVPLVAGEDSGADLAGAMSEAVQQVVEAAVTGIVNATTPPPPGTP
jgi:ABC-type uncharacterized transport system auxiliary subunit